MVGRRFFAVTALAVALVLITSTGTSWAHPGKGKGHAYGHQHANSPLRSTTNDSNVVRSAPADTTSTSKATVYRTATRHGHAHGNRHGNLASHPGKALGLFKHANGPGKRVGQQHLSSPAVRTRGGTPQQPTSEQAVPSRPIDNSVNPKPTRDGSQTTPPATNPRSTPPPTQRPRADQDPASLAQVLLHSNAVRFTALPILIISVLALGVCGLIGLARHRA